MLMVEVSPLVLGYSDRRCVSFGRAATVRRGAARQDALAQVQHTSASADAAQQATATADGSSARLKATEGIPLGFQRAR